MEPESKFFAHTIPGDADKTKWELLETHLRAVASLASSHADPFGSARWGALAGWAHDLGKYQHAFQQYLAAAGRANTAFDEGEDDAPEAIRRVDHSTPGAQILSRLQDSTRVISLAAWCVAGHHCGLMDDGADPPGFCHRLRKAVDAFDIPTEAQVQLDTPALPQLMRRWGREKDTRKLAFRAAMWTRMLFSCLVDADFLCTEQFMQPERAYHRPLDPGPSMSDLAKTVDAHIDAKAAGSTSSPVHSQRQQVLAACRDAARRPAGLFSLTVPTGGGKTLSSLSFALNHAAANGHRRVVYAIPFTSIIEQNAGVFREALGEHADAVIEHHSNRDPDAIALREALASENWDASLIVTTNVQLLESLFANKTSRCRKLHRLARSVIILDEAQSLPVELLRPTLAALESLIQDYGCTVVLCTATQPALLRRDDFEIGLDNCTEIIGDQTAVNGLFQSLRRTRISNLGTMDDEALLARLRSHDQFLCVVNTKQHCADLFDRLHQSVGVYHLSTHMCPAHRARTLATIRERLKDGLACRVVSTSLVEAGVDVDFPVVYRAMAGLDSILQAAGRCNREGKRICGDVFIFQTSEQNRHMLQRVYATQDVLDVGLEPDSLDAINRFFRIYQSRKSDRLRSADSWDDKKVMTCFDYRHNPTNEASPWALQFATAAERYRLIETEQTTIYVPYDDQARSLLAELDQLRDPPSRRLLRRLQAYGVNVYEPVLRELLGRGRAVRHAAGVYVLREGEDAYDPDRGVRSDGADDPERLIL